MQWTHRRMYINLLTAIIIYYTWQYSHFIIILYALYVTFGCSAVRYAYTRARRLNKMDWIDVKWAGRAGICRLHNNPTHPTRTHMCQQQQQALLAAGMHKKSMCFLYFMFVLFCFGFFSIALRLFFRTFERTINHHYRCLFVRVFNKQTTTKINTSPRLPPVELNNRLYLSKHFVLSFHHNGSNIEI